MRILKQWYYSSSPTVKILMAISVTSILVVTNKLYISPYRKRKAYREAEEWANMVIEHEERMNNKENSESY